MDQISPGLETKKSYTTKSGKRFTIKNPTIGDLHRIEAEKTKLYGEFNFNPYVAGAIMQLSANTTLEDKIAHFRVILLEAPPNWFKEVKGKQELDVDNIYPAEFNESWLEAEKCLRGFLGNDYFGNVPPVQDTGGTAPSPTV